MNETGNSFNVEEIFGSKVFTIGKMKERLPKTVYREVVKVMKQGGSLSKTSADVVAKAMKQRSRMHLSPIPMRTAKCSWTSQARNL